MTEAPGTYHHCSMVGNLGEAAAEAIGANGLVVRLGAYYHDIGKLKRPYFFAENQFSGSNPHDNITPQLSTLIITSHVKDGIEMVLKQFNETLSKLGVTPIKAEGEQFDPNLHNAVMHIEDETIDDNTVVEDLMKGYIYKDGRVVRHSMVKVAN